jgi:alpha-1,6-mannosyltransferase
MQTRPVGDEREAERGAASLFSSLPSRGRWSARARAFWARLAAPPADVHPYVEGVTRLRALLWKPATLGFLAVVAIVAGASQPTSPFTLTKVPGSWYFGIPPRDLVPGVTVPPGQNLFVGIVLVYAGMALMMRAWYDIYKVTTHNPGIPVRKLVPVFVIWMLPLLIVAPLFSRDVYSYAAQGEMMSHGINPYSYGPAVLGVNSWVAPVDPLWLNVTSPYGPLFLGAAGSIVSLTGHNELATVIGLRLLAVVGVVLVAIFLPRLARSYGYDGSIAFTLAVLNPLVLLHLVGGAHNDALMLGLLVAGLALARSGRPLVGTVVVALAASVKIPAALGLLYIGWEWLGDEASWRERVRPMVSTLLVAGVVLEVVTQVVGLGWGWVAALANPDTVKSYLDPATAIGLGAGRLLHAIGHADHTGGVLSIARGIAFIVAVAIGVKLLVRSNRATSGRALGMTLLAVTVLGPVMQPWYLAWAIVFLAAVASPRMRTCLIALSCCASFLGLPGAFTLFDELTAANPLLVAAASVALVAVGVLIAGPALRRAVVQFRQGERPVEAMLDL